MAKANTIVSGIAGFDPPFEGAERELPAGGLFVLLADGRRVRLDPRDRRALGYARVLEGLRRKKLTAYLETDPASTITRLLIPLVARVARVRAVKDGGLEVELAPSHARHRLPRQAADFAEFERQLNAAAASGEPVIVTEDDAHNIIDVRTFPGGEPPPPLPLPKPEPPSWGWLRLLRSLLRFLFKSAWWTWCWWPWWWFRCRCVTVERANEIFYAMSAVSCDPLTVPTPCIPFLYPDNGCWARAHEMCRLIKAMGVSPRKVWIDAVTPIPPTYYARLHVGTRNNPQCYVEWLWHVAPTVCVREWRFFGRDMVIDPSLFDRPVTKEEWKSVQGDSAATLTNTDASVYSHSGATDPSYTDTNIRLDYYRLKLQLRATEVGPPPYAGCP